MPPNRVFLEDVRGKDAYLRATWHDDSATIVFSHWARIFLPIGLGLVGSLFRHGTEKKVSRGRCQMSGLRWQEKQTRPSCDLTPET